ncbi:hypothetical protein [Parasitella parasitica]|uniref:GAR domain-containing protein n=1 Tax=Parasitella parasitica TaxID=35722 RepID=A0A0B7N1B5_9FUNG|nr:hypothetical protein [Parasitella parasitica]
MDCPTEICNISTSSPSSTLSSWTRHVLQKDAALNEFADLNFIIDLLSKLFQLDHLEYNNNNNSNNSSSSSSSSNSITAILDQIHSRIPEIFRELPSTIDFAAYDNGDQNQIIPLLAFIQTESQVYHINYSILNNAELSFTANVHQFTSIPTTHDNLESHLLSWASFILSDYIDASLISPVAALSFNAWRNGHYLLCILHYHHPSLVPDLHLYLQQSHVFETAIQCIHTLNPSFNSSCKATVQFIIDLLSCLKAPNKAKAMQRHRDLERFKTELKTASTTNSALNVTSTSTPSLYNSGDEDEDEDDVEHFGTSTTYTSTYTLQQLRITKTTKYSDGTEIPSDLEEFESRAAALTDKINGLQHRLILIVPTRSSSYSPSSVASDSMMELFLTDDNTSSTRTGDNSSHHSLASNEDALQLIHQQQQRRLLHPLQAAEEDYAAYDRNFKALQSEFQALTDGDLHLLLQVYLQQELEPVWRDHPKVLWRKNQLLQLHGTLFSEFERSEWTLSNFRRGVAFARMCSSIRHELDLVQNKMVKSITTHHDIRELEDRMDKTSGMVVTLKTNFDDLLALANDSTADDLKDTLYRDKYDAITSKNELVRTWVEEVRVWFAEAERIRQWIEIRIEQLNSTSLPDPLATVALPATREQVELFNAAHSVLEKEIEAFDNEDMARLRSHVKTLTGSSRADKDLSPADTTTIEITLTTLMTLDKLIHSLRKKSYDLQVLTERVLWEEEYAKSMAWLKETDGETDAFLNSSARWRAIEEHDIDVDVDTDADADADIGADVDVNKHNAQATPGLKRERLMAKERQKEAIVQQLLTLERKMAEFDQGQFTKTVDSFQDLDNTSSVELPAHLESRQDACEQFFEDLMKRMTFARNVVEQRLNVMDFLYQTDMVMEDAAALQLDLSDAGSKARPGDNDREMTARVQSMHERIVQLVTATAGRIPYPVPGLDMDKGPNAAANDEISHVITRKRNDLIATSESLDERLLSFRNVLQLHRKAKEHLDDATRLCDWADERVKTIRRAKVNVQHDVSLTADDLKRLERDRDSVLSKLKNGKENEVVDLLTRIQQLLETSRQLKVASIDKDGLVEVSQQLEERFDRLQQILEEHGLDLEALRKKMEDGNTYFENARALCSFISDTRHSIPGLKQTCGFMTGQSEEQDNRRFDMLNQSLSKISTSYQEQQPQFAQLCARFTLMEPAKVENMDEIRTIQSSLEHDWTQLAGEIKDLEQFSMVVGQWYDRQRRLSMVENELLKGLNEEIAQLAKTSWVDADLERIQRKLDRATELLDETGRGISAADNKEDPLQTANYSCARDRHSVLLSKASTAAANLKALRSNANKAMAFSAFLGEAEGMLGHVQDQKEMVARRMASVGSSGFAAQSMAAIDALCKESQASSARSEEKSRALAKGIESLVSKATALELEGYDAVSVTEPIKRIRDNLEQLANTIALEKKQAMFTRKIHVHAKAADDLATWMSHCAAAIEQLPTDVCMHDEQELRDELDNLEQRMIEMRPTIQAFQAMESRIFTTKDGLPVDFCELSLDRNDIRQAVTNRETAILAAWDDLKKQHAKARALIDSSKRGVEVARKVKAILTQVGDMKDRVSAVRICRNTLLDQGIENRDLKTVLSCPLTSIPNEHRLASAKAELAILDRDMETRLQPAIHELDVMLNDIQNDSQEDIFSGQRTEITTAVRGLMDLMRAKRRAIAEAEKMEGFLTVMEELEVLLLALTEVVSRASPENARIVDGQYSRTDLQALLIDLDTRYRYYEPKINELMDESKQVAENLMDDRRVVECLRQLADKWAQLQAEAAAKKADLMERIGPLAATFDTLEARQGMLQERGLRAASMVRKTPTPVLKQPPSPKMMQSTPRYMTGYKRASNRNNTTTPVPFAASATAARANAKRTTGGTLSPTARRVAARQNAAQQQRQRVTTKTPETYVADPKNDLDVAMGDIINDSPYKVHVKMVPGEVGKYWFGDVNPKLAYCRILRSRMVMVRVGGGWVELSQFLSDHALLEGGNFVTPKGSRASLPPTPTGVAYDGFLNTTVGRNAPQINRGTNGMVSIRGGGGGGVGGDMGNGVDANGDGGPAVRESRSTPYHRGISPGPYGHGIKTGNKFLVTVDGEGNRVEVKMTKAKSKETKFVTPRRINV